MDELDRAPGTLETDHVEVRALAPSDLDWVVRIDAQHFGRPRHEYYQLKLKEAEQDTGVRISLAALVDGTPAGFLRGRLSYGEFGVPEPVAILDSIGIATAYRGQKVGAALMHQFKTNLRGLGIDSVRTQVDWQQFDLMGFFARSGFRPAERLCLEMDLSRPG